MSDLPQIALFEAGSEAIDCAAIDWLVCRREGPGLYDFSRGTTLVSRIDFARPMLDMPDLMAIFAGSDTAEWSHFTQAWQAAFAAAPVALDCLAPAGSGLVADPGAILRRALHHVCGGLAGQRAYAGRMALDLAVYRETFETMQQNFAALEAHVAAAAPAPVREVFHLPPSGRQIVLSPDGPAPDPVVQMLPVNSLGLGEVWLAVAAKPPPGGPILRVALSAIETGATLASWSVDPLSARLGWLHLVLDRALTEAALTLRLAVSGHAADPGQLGGKSWALGLGPENPYLEFCATSEGGFTLDAPLALRLGAVIAGTRVPVTTEAVLQDGSPDRLSHLLPLEAYVGVTEVSARAGEPAVHHDATFGFIQVHPRGQGAVAAARLAVAAPSDTWCVSATIELAHEAAEPARFGMLATMPGTDEATTATIGDIADGAAGFSGWFTLSAMEKRSIATVLPRHHGRGVTLYLLTRQDGAPTFAWARFSRLAVHRLPARWAER